MIKFDANDKGFSLVQIVVAMGLMSLMALAFMRMQENQTKSQRGMRASMEIDNLTQQVRLMLSNPSICALNFKNKKIIKGKLTIDQLMKTENLPQYESGKKYSDGILQVNSMYLDNFQEEIISKEEVDDDGDGEKNVEGKEGKEKEKSEYVSGFMNFNMNVSKLGKIYGANKIVKKFEIYLTMDRQNKILGCGTFGSITGASGVGTDDNKISASTVKKAVVGGDIDPKKNPLEAKKIKEVKKVIEASPVLKSLQESIKGIEESNKRMNDMWEEQ